MIVTPPLVNNYGKYVLHKSVCDHNLLLIRHLLDNKEQLNIDLDERDERGVTPLLYSIHYGFCDVFKMLLESGADPGRKSGQGWNPLQEIISRQERMLAVDLLTYINKKIDREYEKRLQTLVGHLQKIPDFYMELKWDVHSWVPLVSRLCPSDSYKIWKRGADFRLDATLVGMERLQWKRGNISFLFLGSDPSLPRSPNSHSHEITQGDIYLLDREKQTFENVYTTNPLFRVPPDAQDLSSVERFMSMKEVSNANLVVDNVEFSMVKTWFGYEKKEQVGACEGFDGWNAKVYSMDNLDLVTKHRKISRENVNPNQQALPSFKTLSNSNSNSNNNSNSNSTSSNSNSSSSNQQSVNNPNDASGSNQQQTSSSPKTSTNPNPNSITNSNSSSSTNILIHENLEGNFAAMESGCSSNDSGSENNLLSSTYDTFDTLIPKNEAINIKKKKVKGTVWLSDEYPRKVSQILPVFEVLAPTWKHFAKINSFLTMRMPPGEGFPVKLDIPIVPTVSAVVTFGKHVEAPIEKELFEIPQNYKQVFHIEKRRRQKKGEPSEKNEKGEKGEKSEDAKEKEEEVDNDYETGEESSTEQFFDLEEGNDSPTQT